MAWQQKAKKLAQGKWVRFDAENPKHTLTFLDEPKEVEKTSTMGDRKGEKYTALSFPVLEGNDERILEPNMSLLRCLIAEDEDDPIVGRTLMIKCLDTTKKQQWKIKEVAGDAESLAAFQKKKQDDDEEEEETEAIPEKEEQDKAAKEKFHQEVEKRTAKRKAKKPAPVDKGPFNDTHGEAEEGSEVESATVE